MRVRISCFFRTSVGSLFLDQRLQSAQMAWHNVEESIVCVIHSTLLFLYSSRVLITHKSNNRETGKIIIYMRDGDITEYDSLHWLKWSHKTLGSLVSNQPLLFFDQSQRTSWWIMYKIMKLSVLTENEVRQLLWKQWGGCKTLSCCHHGGSDHTLMWDSLHRTFNQILYFVY